MGVIAIPASERSFFRCWFSDDNDAFSLSREMILD
jgi:hypothetical protein